MDYASFPPSLADVIMWQGQGDLLAIQGLTSLGAAAVKALATIGTLVGYVIYLTPEAFTLATEVLDSMHAAVYVM